MAYPALAVTITLLLMAEDAEHVWDGAVGGIAEVLMYVTNDMDAPKREQFYDLLNARVEVPVKYFPALEMVATTLKHVYNQE